MRPALLFVMVLAGCYTEFGLGARSGYATIHGSAGISVELGESGRGSVRAGAGGGIGSFHSSRPNVENGDVTPGPIVLGGHARVLGTEHHALALAGEVYLPFKGGIYFNNFTQSHAADVGRVFLGVGYRHGWSSNRGDREGDGDNDVMREAASMVVAVGPEMFWTTNDSFGDSRDVGGAMSITFAVRGWRLWHFLDCLTSPHKSGGGGDC